MSRLFFSCINRDHTKHYTALRHTAAVSLSTHSIVPGETIITQSTGRSAQSTMHRSLLMTLSIGAVALIVAAEGIRSNTPYGAAFILGALLPYIMAATIIYRWVRIYHPFQSFGAANTVTLIRFVLTCLLAGLAIELSFFNSYLSEPYPGFFLGIAAAGLILDGLDGFLARRLGIESAFGARFDMEVDAFQILALSVIAAMLSKAGWWVLLSGALRYAFVAAAFFNVALNRPLPASFRRKCVAVVQNGVLVMLLSPAFVPPWSGYAAAGALVLLVYSFATEIVWLLGKNSLVQQDSI